MNHPKVLAEYQEIEEALRFERDEAVSSYKQLVEPRMLKRVLLGMSIQMWSQLSGMNVMMYYIVYLMEGQSSHLTNPVLKRANTKYRCEYSFSTPHNLHTESFSSHHYTDDQDIHKTLQHIQLQDYKHHNRHHFQVVFT